MAPITFIILLCTAVSAQEWQYPRFLQPDIKNNPGNVVLVCNDQNSCKVTIDEGVTDMIYIAKLNYNGADPITIKEVNSNYLKPELFENEKKYYIVSKTPQDYETIGGKPINIHVTINKVDDYLYLLVKDINNKKPQIRMENEVCSIQENFIGETSCIMDLEDEDTVCDETEVDVFESGNSNKSDYFSLRVIPKKNCYKEIILVVTEELDYETKRFYKLDINVTDGPYAAFGILNVEVQDMPDQPPIWTMSQTKIIYEEEENEFPLKAIDGDMGLQEKLTYGMNVDDEYKKYFDLNTDTGLLKIKKIDRENLKKDENPLNVNVTAKDSTNETSLMLQLIIMDVNDNSPSVDPCNIKMIFDEGSFYSENNILIKDMDEGLNGTYSVSLEDKPGNNFKDFFAVFPDLGYQESTISISVTKPKSLDFEIPEMRNFSLELVVTEKANSSHTERCEVTINLKNVIDEIPSFIDIGKPNVTENSPKGTYITTLKATDRDANDTLKYSTTSNCVTVNEITGVVEVNEVFDYEKQQELNIQFKVQDSNDNSEVKEFVIQIIDENDSPPSIFIPSRTIRLPENSPNGNISEVRADDEDTSAELNFYINWNASSATQRGNIQQNKSVIMSKFAMNDHCACNEDGHKACSCLEIADNIDWIEMDTVYLNIKVIDNSTVKNSWENNALLVVIIEDINNHPPEYIRVDELNVVENSTSGVKIGYVIAKDDQDGPGNNNITYAIIPKDDTPSDWVNIDENGILTVEGNKEIDYEKYQMLNYTVIASDGDFVVPINITINVEDVNDCNPKLVVDGSPDPIKEYSDPGKVFSVSSVDDDKSDIYNTPTYMLDSRNSEVIGKLFAIDNITGDISTIDKLDYMNGKEYTVLIFVQDNFQNHDNSKSFFDYASIKFTVEDVNNHHPEFQVPKECEAQPPEDTEMNSEIVQIQAHDKDTKPAYSDVIYSITKIINVDAVKEPSEKMFTIDEKSGKISVGIENLKGYIGKYNITVMGRNSDNETLQYNTQNFTICVEDINDHSPVIHFVSGHPIQLQENQRLNDVLIQYNGEALPPIIAVDEDMGNNAVVDFTIADSGNGPSKDYFLIRPIDDKTANLQLKKTFTIPGDREFKMIIFASDRGDRPLTSNISITIQVLTDGHPPYFQDTTDITEFKENDASAYYVIPTAKDYDNDYKEGCDENFHYLHKHHTTGHLELSPSVSCDLIYYSITDGNEENIFYIEKNVLKLNKPLDYENENNKTKYLLTIAATNDKERMETQPNDPSKLHLTVKIKNENDCYPNFTKNSYAGEISTGDKPGKLIYQFEVKDDDPDDNATFLLLSETMEVDDDSLRPYLNGFILNSIGSLILNFSVDNSLSGYFSFQIMATDKANHSDTADVKVYIISEANREIFLFKNHKSFVDGKKNLIEEIFSDYIGYECNVDQTSVTRSYREEPNTTYVTTYFIDANKSLPVENSVTGLLIIEKGVELKREFIKYGLDWADIITGDKSSDNDEDQSALTQTVLIVVSALLASLLLLLLATFFLKIRSYNQRLEALSQTKFGSQDSGLNRVNMNVPNTNQHALEGSNPVWNEELGNEDDISQGSGDSELVGVEDNPEFSPQEHQVKSRRGSKNPIFDDMENEKERTSVEYSPDHNMYEGNNPNFSFGPPTTNIPITEL